MPDSHVSRRQFLATSGAVVAAMAVRSWADCVQHGLGDDTLRSAGSRCSRP